MDARLASAAAPLVIALSGIISAPTDDAGRSVQLCTAADALLEREIAEAIWTVR